MVNVSNHYNRVYKKQNYHGYRYHVCKGYISAILNKIGLSKGSKVLDVGCGQGLFSYMFKNLGYDSYGVDLSINALIDANKNHNISKFIVCDANKLPFKTMTFDFIFTRSCSIFNDIEFRIKKKYTNILLQHVRPGGYYCFAYNTNLLGYNRNNNWVNHTIEDVKHHFNNINEMNPEIYLINKIDVFLCRRLINNTLLVRLNTFISKKIGLNCDIVCILKKANEI